MLEKAVDFYYTLKHKIEKPFYFLIKCFSYAPILYKDYDWEWEFLVELMIFKMKRMRKCILNNNIIMDAKLVHDEILECENKFKAILKDDWVEDELAAFDKKYPEIPDFFATPINRCEWFNSHPDIQQEYRDLLKKKNEVAEEKFKEAFDFFRDHIRCWWD